MSNYTICVIPGDGIGKEVIPSAVQVLQAMCFDADYIYADAGYNCYLKYGSSIPEETIRLCKEVDATLFGAVTTPPNMANYKSAIITIRKSLELFANIRPYYQFPPQIVLPTKHTLDLVIVRENTEDVYSGKEHIAEDTVITERIITRSACERIVRYAFEYALQNNRKKVTFVHKANVMRASDGLFRKIFYTLAKNYPTLAVSEMLVDTAAMNLILYPEKFDIIVTSNMFGDILSDEAAALNGGLGLSPSGNIGFTKAVFEPVHGSAPDIAGKNIANPYASILASEMMLRWLGKLSLADQLKSAVFHAIEQNYLTPDIGGTASTRDITGAVIKNLV